MKTGNKLIAIAKAENSLPHLDAININNWISISNFLNQPRYQKYALWFATGKIAPESGQISPVLAHYGRGSTMF